VAVSWVVFWAGRLIQAVSGRSRVFGVPTVPKRCGSVRRFSGEQEVLVNQRKSDSRGDSR